MNSECRRGGKLYGRLEPDLGSLGRVFLMIEELDGKETIFYMYGCLACTHVTTCVPSALSSQKRASDPQELQLQTAVTCHMGAGN